MSKEPHTDPVFKLAQFIMDEVPGEPSCSEGAIDTAIRLIRSRTEMLEALNTFIAECDPAMLGEPDHPHAVFANAYRMALAARDKATGAS